MILPCWRPIMPGKTARLQRNVPKKFVEMSCHHVSAATSQMGPSATSASGVVDQEINTTQPPHRSVHDRIDGARVSDIRGESDRPPTHSLNRLGRRTDRGL